MLQYSHKLLVPPSEHPPRDNHLFHQLNFAVLDRCFRATVKFTSFANLNSIFLATEQQIKKHNTPFYFIIFFLILLLLLFIIYFIPILFLSVKTR